MTDVALPPVASAAPRRQVAAWALWDWGSAAFNAVMVTFVFGTYLASDAFGPDERGTAWLSTALAIAGVVIALTAPVLLIAALATMLVGILGAIAQSDIKRLLSFTLVSHIGYMIFGIALSSRFGLSGAIFYAVHHILVQTSLFLVVGLVERQAGSAQLRRLGSLLYTAPVIGVLYLIPALNLGGIPPLSGFLGKVMLIQAGAVDGSWLAWVLIGGAVVTESVFAIPGLGRLVVDAILRRDYPVIQGVVLLFSFTYVLVNLGVDLLYTVFDPRIRY